jgi:hypothetical protein
MDSLHERRIACAGLKGGRFIAPQEGGQIILWGLEGGALPPGPVVLQVAPDPRDRVQLGAIWGQEEQTHILRAGKLGGGVRPTMVHHEDLEAVGERVREGVDAELAHLGVQIGPRAEAPVTRRRLHGAIDIAPREDLLDRSNRRHPTCGEASAAAREEAEAAFIWAAHAYRTGMRGGEDGLQAFPTRRLERGTRLRGVLCDWGGPLCAWP